MKKFATLFLCGAVLFSGCGLSNLASGTLIGSGTGAAIGAGIGYLITKDAKGAAVGAAAGLAVGGATGAVIGDQMDKKAKELAALENAQIETITDANGLTAIKVTFASGILFPKNGTALSAEAQEELKLFAKEMSDLPTTNITVWGHTDTDGTAAVNEKISLKRAQSVANYLAKNGIDASRMEGRVEGHSFNEPVADNDTVEGKAKNRRVEIYVTADEAMIEAAKKAAAENAKQN